MNFVRAINAINSNVWAFIALLVGVFLVCNHIQMGSELIVGGFAVMRTSPSGNNTNIEHAEDATVKVTS